MWYRTRLCAPCPRRRRFFHVAAANEFNRSKIDVAKLFTIFQYNIYVRPIHTRFKPRAFVFRWLFFKADHHGALYLFYVTNKELYFFEISRIHRKSNNDILYYIKNNKKRSKLARVTEYNRSGIKIVLQTVPKNLETTPPIGAHVLYLIASTVF